LVLQEVNVRQKIRKYVFIGLGHLFLLLGLIGIVFPLLPATPFILLASACYARGSEHLHAAMLNNRWCGPALRDWKQSGAISAKAKTIAIATIAIGISYSITVVPLAIVKLLLMVVALSVSMFILTRPLPKRGT
jgi:uncharacterized membrane protein YbaN (DUF454 family)